MVPCTVPMFPLHSNPAIHPKVPTNALHSLTRTSFWSLCSKYRDGGESLRDHEIRILLNHQSTLSLRNFSKPIMLIHKKVIPRKFDNDKLYGILILSFLRVVYVSFRRFAVRNMLLPTSLPSKMTKNVWLSAELLFDLGTFAFLYAPINIITRCD